MSRFKSLDDKIDLHLNFLRQKRLWELEKKPGSVKCENLAENIQQDIDSLIKQYEGLIHEQQEAIDKKPSKFSMLHFAV